MAGVGKFERWWRARLTLPGDTDATVAMKQTWCTIYLIAAVGGLLMIRSGMTTSNDVMVNTGVLCLFGIGFLGVVLATRRVPKAQYLVSCVVGTVVITGYDLAALPLHRRGWPFFTLLIDALYTTRAPDLAVNLLICWSCFWVLLTAAEMGFRMGLLDLPGLPPYDARHAQCEKPPCEGGVQGVAVNLVPILVIAGVARSERRFLAAVKEEKLKVDAAVEVCRNVAGSLSRYDLNQAEAQLAAAASVLPDELYAAFSSLLFNLRTYEPYLPRTVLDGGSSSESESEDNTSTTGSLRSGLPGGRRGMSTASAFENESSVSRRGRAMSSTASAFEYESSGGSRRASNPPSLRTCDSAPHLLRQGLNPVPPAKVDAAPDSPQQTRRSFGAGGGLRRVGSMFAGETAACRRRSDRSPPPGDEPLGSPRAESSRRASARRLGSTVSDPAQSGGGDVDALAVPSMILPIPQSSSSNNLTALRHQSQQKHAAEEVTLTLPEFTPVAPRSGAAAWERQSKHDRRSLTVDFGETSLNSMSSKRKSQASAITMDTPVGEKRLSDGSSHTWGAISANHKAQDLTAQGWDPGAAELPPLVRRVPSRLRGRADTGKRASQEAPAGGEGPPGITLQRRKSAMSNVSAMPPAAPALSSLASRRYLRRERMTLICVRLPVWDGVVRATEAADVEQFVTSHARRLSTVLAVTKAGRGMFDCFIGDRVWASFNAFRRAANHPTNALNVASQIMDEFRDADTPTYAAVITGIAMVGQLGTDTVLSPCIVGDLRIILDQATRVAGIVGAQCVCNRAAYVNSPASLEIRIMLHEISLETDDLEDDQDDALVLYELLRGSAQSSSPRPSPKQAKEHEEWMYAMQNEPGLKWEDYNDAGWVLHRRGYDAAMQLLHARPKSTTEAIAVFVAAHEKSKVIDLSARYHVCSGSVG